MKICYVCSAGGHFTEALRIYEELDNGFFVSFRSPNLEDREEDIHYVMDIRNNPLAFLVNMFQSLKILLKEDPDVVLSTGASVAVPMCWLGKLFGKTVIHLEIGCNVTEPSRAGRWIHPVADLFIVEWEQLLEYYPDAEYGGLLI